MHIIKTLGTALIAVAGTVSAANAETLDFNTLRSSDNTNYTYVQGPYHEDGYTLKAGGCQTSMGVPNAGCFIGVQPFMSMDKTGGAIATQYISTPVTVTRDSGVAFMLESIDFSEYFDNQDYPPFTTNVTFTFNFADGTTGTATRVIDNAGQHLTTTFLFDLAALKSFSWTPITGSGVQFDNIVLSDVAVAVPEPATWGMLMLGFGLVGGTMRSRRKQALKLV